MSAALPEVYWGERHGKAMWLCGRCGMGTVAPQMGGSLKEVVALLRAHQRSPVCEGGR